MLMSPDNEVERVATRFVTTNNRRSLLGDAHPDSSLKLLPGSINSDGRLRAPASFVPGAG